jgi:hypothetical protein
VENQADILMFPKAKLVADEPNNQARYDGADCVKVGAVDNAATQVHIVSMSNECKKLVSLRSVMSQVVSSVGLGPSRRPFYMLAGKILFREKDRQLYFREQFDGRLSL